jgi:hypothetical protein
MTQAGTASSEPTSQNGLSVVTANHQFFGARLNWSFERAARTFIVRVVEPAQYEPSTHSELFNAIISELINPEESPISAFDDLMVPSAREHFDLITFPEAFIDRQTLIGALSSLQGSGPVGCVHVGLRGSSDLKCHLFTVTELKELVASLNELSSTVALDILEFKRWLAKQKSEHVFNVACLFAVDAEGHLRVCLHPKIVRSQFETSPLPEKHMEEANLLTLVTLWPADKRYASITIQPLICSDALNLPTDKIGGNPLEGVNRCAACLGDHPPDHIDVVSIATCTPQLEYNHNSGTKVRIWHEQFQDSFKRTAQDPQLTRHHFSAVVLSNFATLPEGVSGGLSGVFMPTPPKFCAFPKGITVSCWGKPKKGECHNNWSTPSDAPPNDWMVRGFIASTDPYVGAAHAPVKIFGFTIDRLPRDISSWSRKEGLTQCNVRIGKINDGGRIHFSQIGGSYGD